MIKTVQPEMFNKKAYNFMQQKIKTILTNEYFILTVFTILALFVRLLNIDKPYGLWNDEILCYSIASKGLPFGIIKEIVKIDFHMPLYYYYLGVWMHLFGNSDVALRLSSVICGVLTVPAFYFMGKSFVGEENQLEAKNLGYFLAFIACFNPVMIYHSQELRFYSMLILFSALSVAFMMKVVDKPSVKNFCFLGVSNLLILYIYSLGGLFVCLQWLVLFIHFLICKKDSIATFIRYSAIFFVLSMPYIMLFIFYQAKNSQELISSFSWGGPPTFDPVAMINDWFSPFLTNLKDGVGFSRFISYSKSIKTMIYMLFLCIPTFCFLIGTIFSLVKINRKTVYITLIALGVLLAEFALWTQGEFHVVTRYTLVILPIILIICANGINLIKVKYLKYLIIGLIGIVYIFNAINYKNMDAFQMRYDGFRFPADTMKSFSSSGDYIISPRYGSRYLLKYDKNLNAIDLGSDKIFNLDKTKREALKLFNKNLVYSTTKNNSMYNLAPYFISPNPTPELKNYINSSVAKIPVGRKIILINGPYGDVSYETGRNFTEAFLNMQYPANLYGQIIFGIAVNKVRYDLENLLKNNSSLKLVGKYTKRADSKEPFQKATWTFYVYKKI